MFLIFNICFDLFTRSTYLGKKTYDNVDPVIAWIALGLKNDGSIFQNLEFYVPVHKLFTKKEKFQFSKNYIYKNKSNFININHLVDKLRYNFASGYIGAGSYVEIYKKNSTNFYWELFSPFGKYFRKISEYTFCYIFAIYYIYLIGFIISLIYIIKDKKISTLSLIIDLSFLGYFIFLMTFEANNRQLYNFIPLIFIGCIIHINKISNVIELIIKKRYFDKLNKKV